MELVERAKDEFAEFEAQTCVNRVISFIFCRLIEF